MTETVPQARGLWQSLGGGQNAGHPGGCHDRPALTPAFHGSSCRPAWPQGHQPRETPWPTGSGPARHGPGEGRAQCRVPQLQSKMQKRGSSVCHFPHRPQTEPKCHLSCGLATNTVATMPVTRAHASSPIAKEEGGHGAASGATVTALFGHRGGWTTGVDGAPHWCLHARQCLPRAGQGGQPSFAPAQGPRGTGGPAEHTLSSGRWALGAGPPHCWPLPPTSHGPPWSCPRWGGWGQTGPR